MADKAQLKILREGVEEWNAWRKQNPETTPDLYGADLLGVDLVGADLSKASLKGAIFNGADLGGADLRGASLVGATFGGANLVRVYLDRADLNGADLAGADLGGASLVGANLVRTILGGAKLFTADLRDAEFAESRMGYTTLADLDLGVAKGLETVKHDDPSIVGIETIYKSKGNIPEVFLRGAGVPEPFIANMRALVAAMEPIQFYSCFISYSTKDQKFADLLHSQLQSKGARVWLATEDLKIGDKFRARIDEAIRMYDKLLLVLSKDSVKSPWVETEVEAAFEKERKQKRTVLFPIRLDDAVMETDEAWAAEIRRTRQIGDFRKWKEHDEYQKALGRLMRDLGKAEVGN
jgi:hypothetical protein